MKLKSAEPKAIDLNRKRLYPGDLLQYDNDPDGFYFVINHFKKLSDTYTGNGFETETNRRCYEVIYLNSEWANQLFLDDGEHETPRQFLFVPCQVLSRSKLILRLNDDK